MTEYYDEPDLIIVVEPWEKNGSTFYDIYGHFKNGDELVIDKWTYDDARVARLTAKAIATRFGKEGYDVELQYEGKFKRYGPWAKR